MTSIDERPDVWIGHVDLPTTDVEKSRDCLLKLGCRPIADLDGISILELRGGTHLVLIPSKDALPEAAPFDLMVEDLEATHRKLTELGLSPSDISSGRIHSSFTVVDPSGQSVVFNSTHVSDLPV